MKTLRAKTMTTPMLVSIAFVALMACSERESPPPQATSHEISGPATGHAARADPRCTPAFTPDQCAMAMQSLERDARQLGEDAASQTPSPTAQKQREDSQNRALQDAYSKECTEQKDSLAAMRRQQSPSAGDRLSKDELGKLPEQIANMEAYIDRSCR